MMTIDAESPLLKGLIEVYKQQAQQAADNRELASLRQQRLSLRLLTTIVGLGVLVLTASGPFAERAQRAWWPEEQRGVYFDGIPDWHTYGGPCFERAIAWARQYNAGGGLQYAVDHVEYEHGGCVAVYPLSTGELAKQRIY